MEATVVLVLLFTLVVGGMMLGLATATPTIIASKIQRVR